MSEFGVTITLPGAPGWKSRQSGQFKPEDPVTLGVRPEHLRLGEQGQFKGKCWSPSGSAVKHIFIYR